MDALGQTALHRAAASGQIQACRILLAHGAEPNQCSFQGYTAAEVGTESIQKFLRGIM